MKRRAFLQVTALAPLAPRELMRIPRPPVRGFVVVTGNIPAEAIARIQAAVDAMRAGAVWRRPIIELPIGARVTLIVGDT